MLSPLNFVKFDIKFMVMPGSNTSTMYYHAVNNCELQGNFRTQILFYNRADTGIQRSSILCNLELPPAAGFFISN